MESTVKKDHVDAMATTPKTHVEHHKTAAAHHTEAAKHHTEAAKHIEEGHHEKAAVSTLKANGHSEIAAEHHKAIEKAHVTSK